MAGRAEHPCDPGPAPSAGPGAVYEYVSGHRRSGGGGVVAQHRLQLEVLGEGVVAELAAVAGVLVAPEGDGDVHRGVIYGDVAGADLAGDLTGLVLVGAGDVAAQ